VEVATMVMSNKYACAVSLDLGLVISLMNPYEGVEAARGFPQGMTTEERRDPDLRVTPILGESGTNHVEALTEDGEAFLELVRAEDERLHRLHCDVCI
jgi:hypothetical protein